MSFISDWTKRSLRGEVCRVVGCKAEPKPNHKCPICGVYSCDDHFRSHYHTITFEKERQIKKEENNCYQ